MAMPSEEGKGGEAPNGWLEGMLESGGKKLPTQKQPFFRLGKSQT